MKPHLERVMDEARASDDPLVKGLLSELEERLRLNVGILAENKELKRLGETSRLERAVIEAVERWEARPEHFWGSTPDTGSEIEAALVALRERVL